MDELDVETWIMHGTLLAWWWNQKVRILLSFPAHFFNNILADLPLGR